MKRTKLRSEVKTHHTSSVSSSHSAPYLHVLHLVNFLATSEPEPSSSTKNNRGEAGVSGVGTQGGQEADPGSVLLWHNVKLTLVHICKHT